MTKKNLNTEVLMVSTNKEGKGGIASVVTTYIDGGLQNNYCIRFLATHAGDNKFQKLLCFVWSLLMLPKYLLSRRCKIFHIHTASRSSFIRKSIITWAGLLFRKKVILHLHGGEFMQFYTEECGSLSKWYIKQTFNFVSKVVVLSSQWEKNIHQISNIASIVVLFNPVIVNAVERNEIDAKTNILLFLGRIGEGKGFWDILNALSIVNKTHSDFIFKYGGDGEIEKAEKMINELGLDHNTEYLGWVTGEQKQKILNESLIYLLPSYNEGLPIGILEAMASKVSIIASPVGGIPDAISDKINGLLIQPGDVGALSEAIKSLLDSDILCQALSDKAYEDVRNKFSVDVVVPQIESLYQELDS